MCRRGAQQAAAMHQRNNEPGVGPHAERPGVGPREPKKKLDTYGEQRVR